MDELIVFYRDRLKEIFYSRAFREPYEGKIVDVPAQAPMRDEPFRTFTFELLNETEEDW